MRLLGLSMAISIIRNMASVVARRIAEILAAALRLSAVALDLMTLERRD